MNFFDSYISPESIEYVNEVLRTGWISEGEYVQRFEKELTSRLNLSHPSTVNSGTSALVLAQALADVGPGDEVIVPPQTFIATAMSVMQLGAKPIFADIQKDTGNIGPKSIASKITPKTKAVIPVHWGGYPCDLDEIKEVVSQSDQNIRIIEDAAHALGAKYRGNSIGSISDFTVLSFQAIKHLTTGDGGAVCCKNEEDYEHARRLKWFGIDRKNTFESPLGNRDYPPVTEIGYKFHMNNIAAAIGLGNLEHFQKRLELRQKIGKLYIDGLKDVSGVQLLNFSNDREHAFWIFTLLSEDRIDLKRKLNEHKIPVNVVDLRIDRNTIFGKMDETLENQQWFNERQISLPVGPSYDLDHYHRIVEIIARG